MCSNKKYTLLSLFISFIVVIQLVSCQESSTSIEEPEAFENCGDRITDTDGNIYQTVQIGDQCWMAEDLRTTFYRDGTSIPNVPENDEWATLSVGGWAYYANNDLNSDINGKLYNWFTVNDSKGICIAGWKVPSDNDWKNLEMELGMTPEEANSLEWRGDGIGEIMRDTNGFSASLGGTRASGGAFSGGGNNGSWWSSSQEDASTAWTRFLRSEFTQVYRNKSNKNEGLSVRCVLI
jgi:uncharacterized protein (TIGR02145 family)